MKRTIQVSLSLIVVFIVAQVFAQEEMPISIADQDTGIIVNLPNISDDLEDSALADEFVEAESDSEGISEKGLQRVVIDNTVNISLDKMWLLFCAVLVFFMQAGFKSFEMGMVRKEHGDGIGMKNLIDWIMICGFYYLIGYGLMFGPAAGPFDLFGSFYVPGLGMEKDNIELGLEFFIFQLAFAGTAATIVSGAMSERTGLLPYILTSLFVGVIVYPIFGRLVWGNLYFTDNKALLADLGFIDFAGSTVVHSIGGWVALMGLVFIGPRLGRYDVHGNIQKEKFKPYSLGYSILGVFILMMGWWGFNGGSNLAITADVPLIILNTNLAGAFGGISALFYSYFLDKDEALPNLMGGVLGGLVAVTASSAIIEPASAVYIGLIAGVLYSVGNKFLLEKLRLDDPVGAVSVHGFCGVFGTMAVALFGKEELIRSYLKIPEGSEWSRIQQILIQAEGVIVAFTLTSILAWIFFFIVDNTIGLRVDPEKEKTGYILISKLR